MVSIMHDKMFCGVETPESLCKVRLVWKNWSSIFQIHHRIILPGFPISFVAVPNSSPHMDNFNRIVHSLKEAGITVFWEMDVVRKFLSERQQLSVVHSRSTPDLGPKKLRLILIQDAFILLFVGKATAFVAIFAEVAYVRYETCSLYIVLGAMAKFRKATISFVLSLNPTVYLSAWNNSALTGRIFMKFELSIFRKPVENIHYWLNSEKNNRHFTWRSMYIYDNMSLNSS